MDPPQLTQLPTHTMCAAVGDITPRVCRFCDCCVTSCGPEDYPREKPRATQGRGFLFARDAEPVVGRPAHDLRDFAFRVGVRLSVCAESEIACERKRGRELANCSDGFD